MDSARWSRDTHVRASVRALERRDPSPNTKSLVLAPSHPHPAPPSPCAPVPAANYLRYHLRASFSVPLHRDAIADSGSSCSASASFGSARCRCLRNARVILLIFPSTVQLIDMSPTVLMLPVRRFVTFVTLRCREIGPMSGEGLAATLLIGSGSGCIRDCMKVFRGAAGADAWTYEKLWGKERELRERDVHTDEPVRECSQLQVDHEHPLPGESETRRLIGE